MSLDRSERDSRARADGGCDLRSGPQTARGRERYERIVAATERLFAERDYHDVSINDVVKESGGSLATVYKWFGSKDELLYAVLRRRVQLVNATIGRFSFSGSSLEEDLNDLVDAFALLAPLRLVRASLFYSSLFQRYSREISALCDREIVAPLTRLFDELCVRWRALFKLDSRGMALVIIRYIRGYFIEAALDRDASTNAQRASDDLKQILVALIASQRIQNEET